MFWHRTPILLGRQRTMAVCSVCSSSYEVSGLKRSREYCSRRCGEVAQLRRSWVPHVRSCAVCSGEYVAFNTGQRYCDAACRYLSEPAKAERRRKGQLRNLRKRTGGEYIDTVHVAELHGWTCGLCALPIDPSLQYPDPASLSLDHVVPLARGGAHTLNNVQPAHLRCNIRKGARDLSKAVA